MFVHTVLINAKQCDWCFPLSDTPVIDRYFQEYPLKGSSFLAFHVRNCLLARLTRHVDTRHAEPHSHIFLMSRCYDVASNCPDGQNNNNTTKNKVLNQPRQTDRQTAKPFPSHLAAPPPAV